MIEHGASANARQHGGWTPLHAVAQTGDLESARALVAAGADVQTRADNNQTALDLALTKGATRLWWIISNRMERDFRCPAKPWQWKRC